MVAVDLKQQRLERNLVTEVMDLIRSALADRFDIQRELGRGGMATVFLAEEHHPRRKVAIKVLEPELATQIARERFLREVEVAAGLTHPNIVPIFSAGEREGLLYYVMPFIDGPNLRTRLARESKLPIAEAVRVAKDVADALHYAHSSGVIHRDVKPENILFAGNHPVVADFGIARAVAACCEDNLTVAGFPIGTPGYMSPEQAAGRDDVDARTDVYGLGCVVYEMLTGERPFKGNSAEEILAQRADHPTPALQRDASPTWDRIDSVVRKALAFNPADRFDSTAAFAAALAGEVLPPTLSPDEIVTQKQTGNGNSIAVLPFANLSPDPENEYFSDGITEDIITQLSRLGDLKVTSRTSVMRYKSTELGTKEIARELGVNTILEGSVRRAGDRVRVVAQLVDAAKDEHLWADTYDRQLTDIFEIQTDVAGQIAGALQATLTPAAVQQFCTKPTEHADAYNLYLKGRFYHSKLTEPELRKAIKLFESALEIDPDYAQAYAGIADCYLVLGSSYGSLSPELAYPKAREMVEKALEACDLIADAHATQAAVHIFYDWDWAAAERSLARAKELEPANAKVELMRGFYFAARSRHADAIRAGRRAVELDPVSLPTNSMLGLQHYWAREYERALAQFDRTLDMNPDFSAGLMGIAWTEMQRGNYDESIARARRAIELTGQNPAWIAALGHILAAAGRQQDARRILGRLHEMSSERYVSPADIGILHGYLGEFDQAFDWLERAFQSKASWMPFLGIDPIFDVIRHDQRFPELLKRLGLY